MSVKDLINAISMGNAAETQDLFQAVMAEKISARLDEMRVEVARNMFKEEAQIEEEYEELDEDLTLEDYSLEELEDFMMSEDFEQLDELSGKVLGSYIQKARADARAKQQHEVDLDKHPKVAAQRDKTREYMDKKKWKQYHASLAKERDIKLKIDPNLNKTGSLGAAKRRRGIEKALHKLTYGKLTD